MENTLDQGVLTMLNGLDMSKYISLFEKYKVSLDLFLSLTEEDLRLIGISDQEEIDLLSKYIKKYRKINKWEMKPMEYEEITQVLDNSEKYFRSANIATCFIQQKLDTCEPIDARLSDDLSISLAMSKLTQRINAENCKFIEELDSLIEATDANERKSYRKPFIHLALGTMLVASFYCLFTVIRKNYLR